MKQVLCFYYKEKKKLKHMEHALYGTQIKNSQVTVTPPVHKLSWSEYRAILSSTSEILEMIAKSGNYKETANLY